MSNMFTPREIGDLIDYGHRNQQPSANQLRVIWDFDIIGMQLRAQQHFATAPCVFDLMAVKDGETIWKVKTEFQRAVNTPTHLFGKEVDDPMLAGIFAVKWRCTALPILMECVDDERFTNDLLMLRMSKDLWEYP